MSEKADAVVFSNLTNRLMCYAVTENASTEKILLTIEEYEIAANVYRTLSKSIKAFEAREPNCSYDIGDIDPDDAMGGIDALTSRISLNQPEQCDVITSHPQFKWALYVSDILASAIKAFLQKIDSGEGTSRRADPQAGQSSSRHNSDRFNDRRYQDKNELFQRRESLDRSEAVRKRDERLKSEPKPQTASRASDMLGMVQEFDFEAAERLSSRIKSSKRRIEEKETRRKRSRSPIPHTSRSNRDGFRKVQKGVLSSEQRYPKHGRESDPETLARRDKQIELGKNTLAYDRYLKLIPKKKRVKRNPRTPDRNANASRRDWDRRVKRWKLAIHTWNYENPVDPKFV